MQNLKDETTFLMIKPDGVKKGLVGEIIKRIEQRGLKIVRLEMAEPGREMVMKHYPTSDAWVMRLGDKLLANFEKFGYDPVAEFGTVDPKTIGEQVKKWLVDYMTLGPIVKMIIQGPHAIDMVRKIVGPTIPANAEMGTIRGDFSVDSSALSTKEKRAIYNLAHASENLEEATHEIKLWFGDSKIFDY